MARTSSVDEKEFAIFQKKIRDKMLQEGYRDVTDFSRRSGVGKHLVFETVRRTFNNNKCLVGFAAIGVIMKFLGYGGSEIKDQLIKLGDDTYYVLIGDSNVAIWEQAIIDTIKDILTVDTSAIERLQDYLLLLSQAASIDCSANLAKIAGSKKISRNTSGKEGMHHQTTTEHVAVRKLIM